MQKAGNARRTAKPEVGAFLKIALQLTGSSKEAFSSEE
jgi:hypothetical protein